MTFTFFLVMVLFVLVYALFKKVNKIMLDFKDLKKLLSVDEAKSKKPQEEKEPEPNITPIQKDAQPIQVAKAEISKPKAPPKKPIDWEKFTGVNLFAWVGGFAFFLGMVFFLKYAIDNNLISPLVRILIGFVLGITAIASGIIMKDGKFKTTANTLCGVGVTVLYISIYAANSFYDLINNSTAFFAMALVSVVAFWCAVHLKSKYIAILGLIGGFLTPILLSTGVDKTLDLFTYIFVLNIAIIFIAIRMNWPFLIAMTAGATFFTQFCWYDSFFNDEKTYTAIIIFAIFPAIYSVAALIANKYKLASKTFLHTAGIFIIANIFFTWNMLFATSTPFPVLSLLLILSAYLVFLMHKEKGCVGWHITASFITFLVLFMWTIFDLSKTNLNHILGFYLAFAVLNSVIPIILFHYKKNKDILTVYGISLVLPFILMVAAISKATPDSPTFIFGAALLLVGIILSIVRIYKIDFISMVALIGAFIVQITWHLSFKELAPMYYWYGGFMSMFLIFPFLFRKYFMDSKYVWISSALAGPLCFIPVYYLSKELLEGQTLGFIPAMFAVIYLTFTLFVSHFADIKEYLQKVRLGVFAAVSLLFITLIFPIQFDKEWLTISWALEGMALIWLFRTIEYKQLKLWGYALLIISFVRIAIIPIVLMSNSHVEPAILNSYLYTHGLVILPLLIAAKLWQPNDEKIMESNPKTVLAILGTVLLFLLMNIEIANYFATGTALTFELTGNIARDMTYTLSWGIFAMGLFAISIYRDSTKVRIASIVLFSITTLKLFFIDLWHL